MQTPPPEHARPAPNLPLGPFRSILYDGGGEDPGVAAAGLRPQPDCFHDLHLDEIVAAISAGREAYDLAPYFNAPLVSLAAIAYRQEVFRDLEDPPILAAVRSFARAMGAMRDAALRARRSGHRLEEQRWTLSARERYCDAMAGLARDLVTSPPRSRGLRALAAWLDERLGSGEMAALIAETRRVAAGLAALTYRLEIAGTRIRVSRFEAAQGSSGVRAPAPGAAPGAAPIDSEPDYGADVRATFERFRQGAGRTFAFEADASDGMNRLESEVVERVARLFPAPFAALGACCARHVEYLDATIVRFDREVQVYVAVLELAERLRAAGLAVSAPTMGGDPREVRGRDVYDLALAIRRVGEGAPVVTNDVDLREPERIVVVSGPNQGGKTTFARTVGQLHYLASLGCPVPGRDVRLPLVDRIFTHFEKAEDIRAQGGKLEDELLRIRSVLDEATPDSLLVLNESFGSTSLADALAISREVMRTIEERGALCVFVTFLDELAAYGPAVVSMVSTVDPADPAVRTFLVVRRAADGLAYAAALARKHRLTEGDVRRRVGGESPR